MITLPAERLRVVGYEGSLRPRQTPARQLPLFAATDEGEGDARYRLVAWRGDHAELEPGNSGDFTPLPDTQPAVPGAYFVVLGDQERAHRRALEQAFAARGLDPVQWTAPLTHLYLTPRQADDTFTAIRDVATRAVRDAAVAGRERELEELGWWLYAAAREPADVALAARALERADLPDARELAEGGFRRFSTFDLRKAEQVGLGNTLPAH